MSLGKMHADEWPINITLVTRLLAAQFPPWTELALTPVASAGTDHALYRLGSDMVVRLPRIASASEQVDKEQIWLPRLAPYLPLAIPVPLALGTPTTDYPWQWSIYHWLAGENATLERIAKPNEAAHDLAHFITALQHINTESAPLPGVHNGFRGIPLARRDAETRAAITSLAGIIDTDAVTAAWNAALQAPAWQGSPVWIHGDLSPLNLLVTEGRLSAVIDFGCLSVGDPACDLQVAWNLFSTYTRAVFRTALGVDDAAWARGRGWSLSVALIALPYYQYTNPVLAGIARRTIAETLADHEESPSS